MNPTDMMTPTLAGKREPIGGMLAVAESRSAQETQVAMVIAQRFPRDQVAAYERIMTSCNRRALAENAVYAFPRGSQTVSGPSIRLAEVLAQNWGNLDFGISELEQRDGESVVQAYCWDMETNTRQTKTFTVPHVRYTKNGSYDLKDPRDIYELVANQGARRLRACILGIIPGDIVDAAVAECEKTLQGQSGEPLQDRVRKMVAAFGRIGVTAEMVVRRLGHVVEATGEAELVELRKIFRSISDGMSGAAQWFDRPSPIDKDATATAGDLVRPRLADGGTGSDEDNTTSPADGGDRGHSPSDRFLELVASVKSKRSPNGILQAKQEVIASRDHLSDLERDELAKLLEEKISSVTHRKNGDV